MVPVPTYNSFQRRVGLPKLFVFVEIGKIFVLVITLPKPWLSKNMSVSTAVDISKPAFCKGLVKLNTAPGIGNT